MVRRLMVNADDFGRTPDINAAVIRSHREGILTTASLMVNAAACHEAVGLAREHPSLGVGLHLTLACGKAALAPGRVSGLVDEHGQFRHRAVWAGLRYFFLGGLRESLRAEIRAQFERFRATGLPLDHVNGHLHFHLHPVVLKLLIEEAEAFGLRYVRLTRDPFWLNLRLARGRFAYRASHALAFAALASYARGRLLTRDLRHTARVFGLLQDGRVDEDFLVRLLPCLPEGDSELYSHPSLAEPAAEFKALVSPRVGRLVRDLGIQLICGREI